MFDFKQKVFGCKGFAHSEKKFAYIHKTNPQQIATAHCHGK